MSQKKKWGEKTCFLLLALFFNRIFTTESHLFLGGEVASGWRVAHTLKLHELMEVLLVDVCGSGFRRYVIFHYFFNSCLLKKPFSVTIERG